MNDSTEHTVRETSPTPPLRHSLQGPLLRRNADTQMQLWGGKDEECSGNQGSYGMGRGESWHGLAQSGGLQVALGQTVSMVSSFILTTCPLNTLILQRCGQQQDSQGPRLHRTHRQTTTMTMDVKEGRFQLCVRQNTLTRPLLLKAIQEFRGDFCSRYYSWSEMRRLLRSLLI